MPYQIKLPLFEGPLDLLLKLIENKKLEVTKLAVSEVTDEYLRRIKELEQSNEEVADFLDIASKLVYIKSKSILPSNELEDETEEILEDLEKQLLEYKKVKEAADRLNEILDRNLRGFEIAISKEQPDIFLPPSNITLHQLSLIFEEVLKQMPKQELKIKKHEKKITVEEKIAFIQDSFRKTKIISFSRLLSKSKSRTEVLVTFLAVLEALKRRIINIDQKENFGEISITSVGQQKV